MMAASSLALVAGGEQLAVAAVKGFVRGQQASGVERRQRR